MYLAIIEEGHSREELAARYAAIVPIVNREDTVVEGLDTRLRPKIQGMQDISDKQARAGTR